MSSCILTLNVAITEKIRARHPLNGLRQEGGKSNQVSKGSLVLYPRPQFTTGHVALYLLNLVVPPTGRPLYCIPLSYPFTVIISIPSQDFHVRVTIRWVLGAWIPSYKKQLKTILCLFLEYSLHGLFIQFSLLKGRKRYINVNLEIKA